MIDWAARGADTPQDRDPRQTAPRALRITADRLPDLLADLDARLREGRGFSLATMNLDHLVKLRENRAFLDAYRAHSHVTADGNPIVWLSRLAGRPVDLVPGSDLIGPVTRLAAEAGTPVALFGATAEALAAAEVALCRDAPGLRVVARIAPPMGFDPTGPAADAAIEEIGASGARLCLLALGAPKQEIFAAHASARLPQTGFMSIGAGLDFLAGTQTRAPAWVRRMAGEWLWRLAGSPRRMAGRYARCFAILPGQAVSALRARRG
ncbi:WecB/TagA/CpsF family glycosyltransferase [Paracoccus sp. 1_MG-2023]|uniref:WecB/TagA/CpsF family glycosyltransferase n=1 Tax=unclassified Paracoccus (in: a-proteobacteria) TaxID=2688777 RepID=UPI001C09AC15|nr:MULTISPECIES: WecB/TagA/CpsF family glycosyltransferase [unclassified Paracoccus (in: a-proteobacteria)]MBU2958949.1 WecB/TagA/CpsF family glycosyltransferase [Paracoccus sp. C2R09]MDO6669961.1 WecB/TagA/CpsF family glycosyltransferase [Paracoccus sp. 1_MG-2023]